MKGAARRARWWATNARIVLALVAVSAALHLLGLRRAMVLLDRLVPRGETDTSPDRRVARGVTLSRRIAHIAEGLPRPARCLTRSLVLRAALRRRGIDAVLRIGVRREREFEAHAWVEVDGVAVGEPEDVHAKYAAFSSALSGEVGSAASSATRKAT